MRIIKQSTNTVFILLFVIVSAAGLLVEENQPCNTERDILLATDPSQNTQTYLKCVPANIGSIGFWNKLFCAPATKFDFVTQSCIQDLSTNGLGGTFNFNAFKSYTNTQAYKTPPQTKEQLPLVEPPLKIAILNNSCVNGETCIGNSICDISAGVCKCPYGHTADLSTLSCNEDKPDGGPMVVSTVQQEDGSFKFTFRSQGPYSFNQQLSDLTMAKPTYKKVDNPEKIEFVGAKYPAEMPTIKPFAVLKALFAKPGEACTDGKICGGGSYCMAPAMLCLCPGTLIEKHGECVHPVHETPAVEKVNVGGLCNTYSECQDDSSCVLGRCRCISPLLEIAGKCIFQMAPKEVGPGEVCENGEVCIKGSICSADIPVCICPVGTDLEDDICVPVLTTDTNTAPTLKPPTTMPQLPDTLPPTTAALPTTETSTTSSTTTTTTTTTPIPTTSTTTTIPPETKISTIYTMPTLTHTYPNRPLSAGAKFLKVSETCSLNTDCMMGAYCNGNTNPPTCQCLSTHVNVNGKCEKVIYPGQYGCKNDIQCSVSYPGSVCLDRQCNCPLGYRAIEQTCVSVSHRLLSPPGGSCDSEETCTGNSVCRNDYCVCREPNMIVINGLCLTSDILASTKVFETVTTVQTPSSPVYSTIGLKQNIGDRLAETIYQNTFGPTEPSTIANTPTTQLIPVLANTNGGRKAAPGMNCGPLDSCVGGSQCLDNFCICPQGTIADTVSGRCETAAEEEEDEEAVTEAVEEPRKGTLKQSAIYSFIPTTTSTNQQLINSLIINNQQKTPILNSISTTKAPNSFKNNLINTDLTELNRLNLINPDSTATNSFNLINTDSTSKIVTSTPLPLPNPQLYIIRRPATAYNSLTTSFLSKHPGQDIRENIPTIVHHHNISVISLNPDNNNNGDQPKGDLYTIPFTQTYRSSSKEDFNKDNGINDKDLPTFATLFGGMALTTSNPFNFNKFKNLNNNGSPSEIIKTEKSLEVPQVKLSSLPSAPSIVNEVVVDECAKQGLLCRGGSVCRSIDITCQCPEDYVLLNDRCMPPTRRRFSQRKGKSSSVVNDQSTSYPNESCQDGQACVGGSECGPEKVRSIKELFHAKKVCTCPSSRPIIRDNVCTSVNSTQLEKIAGPGEECSFEVKCSENAECSQSLCRCNSGFIAISNECMKLPTAQSVSITNNVPSSDLKLQSAGGFGSNSGAKPRIVGAPIRRTKKIKNGGKGAITTTNEAGICPSGNEPTRDDATNKVISCSGMTPNCPPRSYCYVTGVADGIFNCCKSS